MEIIEAVDPELQMIRGDKEDGLDYRKRRHDEWTENYTLYRDRVQTNRLTQRQTVNLPLMKIGLRTLFKDVDDMPEVYFENLDNDKQAEVFKNEYWKHIGSAENNNFEIQDLVDKKQVFHFGRTIDQWQIVDGMPKMTIQDPMDILVSRYTNPTSIHSSRFFSQTHIFVPLTTLQYNPDYDKTAINELVNWHATDQGLIKAGQNQEMLMDKNDKMRDMGVLNIDSPVLGETIVELTNHFRFYKESGDQKEQIYLYVVADDYKVILRKPLEKIIGVTKDNFWQTHYPYNSWADDVDMQDFWTDGIADILRGPNKILNVWYSQLIENRTLRSFGMNFYKQTEGWNPQTFQPIPFGWYSVPGDPKELIQRVDIPDLTESLDEMNFVQLMAEKASGATATEQGAQTDRQITLGEVQLALGEAKERIKGMAKFYTNAWVERAIMFTKLVEAAEDQIDAVKVFKKGKNTDTMYSREIEPKDWTTQSGYKCKVWSKAERDELNTKSLERHSAVKANMPDNPVVDDKYKRKLLEFGDYSPDEMESAMEFEQMKKEALMAQANNPMSGIMPGAQQGLQPGNPAQPVTPQLPAQAQQK